MTWLLSWLLLPSPLPLLSDPLEDVQRFKETGAHVIIGTPGRIDDVIKRCPVMEFKRLEVGGVG